MHTSTPDSNNRLTCFLKWNMTVLTNRYSWISDGHSPFSELSLDSNQWDDRSQKVRYVDQWNVRRSVVTPIPEPESASEAGHWEGEEEYTEKIFNTKICWYTSLISGSATTHAFILIFSSPLSIFLFFRTWWWCLFKTRVGSWTIIGEIILPLALMFTLTIPLFF